MSRPSRPILHNFTLFIPEGTHSYLFFKGYRWLRRMQFTVYLSQSSRVKFRVFILPSREFLSTDVWVSTLQIPIYEFDDSFMCSYQTQGDNILLSFLFLRSKDLPPNCTRCKMMFRLKFV